MRAFLTLIVIFFIAGSISAQNWIDYKKQIDSLSAVGKYKVAIQIVENAIDSLKNKARENQSDYSSFLNELASLNRKTGQYQKSETLYLQAKEIRERVLGVNHADYAQSLNGLGVLYYYMGQYQKAESFYLQAKEIRRKALGENHPDYAESLNNLAALYFILGQADKAENFYLQAKEIRKTILGENHPDYAQALGNLAALYDDMGLYLTAEGYYLQAKKIWEKSARETNVDYAQCLTNFAGLYRRMGQYEKAENFYLQVKEIWKKIFGENHPEYARSLMGLASFYVIIGQYEKAEPLYLQAKDIRKKAVGENHPDYTSVLNNLAFLYSQMGRYSEAEPLYIQAKEIRKATLGENHPQYANVLNNLAVMYKTMGQYEKAEPLYIEAKEIRKKALGEEHPDYASSLNNLATFYRVTKQYEKAEPLYIQSKEILKKAVGEYHPNYIANLNNLTLLYSDMGEYGKAEPIVLIKNHNIVQGVLNTLAILSEKEKNNYLKNNTSVLETDNSLLYNYRNPFTPIIENNLNLQYFFKSISLQETRNILDFISNSKDTTIGELANKWRDTKKLLAKQYSLTVDKRLPRLDSIEAEAEYFEKELSRKSNKFRDHQKLIRISTMDVKKMLNENEAAIEFVQFNLYYKGATDSIIYAAYLLKKDSLPVFIPLLEEKQLQKIFDRAGTTTTSMVGNFYRGIKIIDKNSANLGNELYKLIWAPLEPYLKGIKKIYYSPAGKLYNIAFHALPVDSATILMDKYKLNQYTSTRQVALRSSEKEIKKPQSITLFGDASFTLDSLQLVKQKINQTENIPTNIYTPQNRGTRGDLWINLPGTATEVNKIKQLFDQNKIITKSFTNIKASEENLKALSGNSPQVLHIATHGFFLPEPDKKRKEPNIGNENAYTLAEDPLLRSGLILAGGNYAWSGKTPIDGVEDGIATAYEISQLNLSNTELVVLSACETALGDIKGSEGVFGLQRAFKMAGVKKMIVSLWQVPDKETAELMTTFYTYWLKGKTINESFVQAQADMRKKYSPYYWAAFVLVE